ncbi:Golgi apparatus protein 1 [Cylas formicarius]|uniref:Golgi apparatus protein 1 n=1 Tax=Cylas formicarius TaxID=197179 RepID=UPI002958C279|nr:Golgi apparatus protein 1 [Cylas formicarius]
MFFQVCTLFTLLLCVLSAELQQARHEASQTIMDISQCSSLKSQCNTIKENDDLSFLECVQSLHPKEVDGLSATCQTVIWKLTNNVISNENVMNLVASPCRNDMNNLKCTISDGNFLKCLTNGKDGVENEECRDIILRLENVAFTDNHFIDSFLKECEKDVTELQCGKIDSQGMTQLKTVSCLQENILKVSDRCKKEVFKLTELQSDNIKLDRQLYLDCAEDHSRYCSQFAPGSGRVFHCLARQDPSKLGFKCKQNLLRRKKIISQDYRVSKGLMRACREDIKRTHCRRQTSSDKTVRLAQILLCLENISKNGSGVSSDCQAEMIEHRKMLMEDYRLSPEIVDNCKGEISYFCNGVDNGGKTIHCLMDHARNSMHKDHNFDKKCQKALEDLIKQADIGENWKVDPVLQKACSAVVSSACQDIKSGEARVMNCLMDNIGTAHMTDDCEDALIQIQYFISRKFELDSQLFTACKDDAVKLCLVNSDWDQTHPQVLPCLYRYADQEERSLQLNKSCLMNIRRIMRQRALSVDLEPSIEDNCLLDLGQFCHDKVKKGEEMLCLQKNYNDLEDQCQKTVGLFTEFQAEHAEVNPYISKYCGKIIKTLCTTEAKNDEGDIMECLITHKNDVLVKANQPCRASIEHFQLISLNDYRFSYKFKVACKPYAMRFCSLSHTKNEVVRCLSEQVLNATIRGIKGQVSRECKQQLKAQLFQQHESIDYDPVLKAACQPDIKKYCNHISAENAQVLECLQTVNSKLTDKCEKEVFKVKKQEIYDNSVDYALKTMCADAIEQFCPHQDKDNVLECLKKNKNELGFNKKCRTIVIHRMIEQNSNYQLNPSLQQNCNMDIEKFCANILSSHVIGNADDVVIKCLKSHFKLGKLSNKCEKEITSILREQALDVNLNPLIRAVCANELKTICKVNDEENSGDAEECLKDALLNSRIQTPECKNEIANMIEESQADIQADPLLQKACALDLLNYCSDIPQGNGRHINCLKIVLEGNQKISVKCKNMLKKRFEMYRNAAQLVGMGPPEDLQQLYNQVVSSPSKQYFFLILLTIIGSIFLIGIMCGRLNKRKYMLLKTK